LLAHETGPPLLVQMKLVLDRRVSMSPAQ